MQRFQCCLVGSSTPIIMTMILQQLSFGTIINNYTRGGLYGKLRTCWHNSSKRSFMAIVMQQHWIQQLLLPLLHLQINLIVIHRVKLHLCLQIRCNDSHALLFSEAGRYGLEVMDRSEELNIGNCVWGLEFECMLLQMNVVKKKRYK